jgi:hypothetical protein
MWCRSEDKTGAIRLWKHAKQKAKGMGYGVVYVSVREDDPLTEFWKRRGFRPVFTMYEGAI